MGVVVGREVMTALRALLVVLVAGGLVAQAWFFPALAVRDTTIRVNDRICQFRIVKHQPTIEFDEVEHLGNPDRGGHGSTGKQ